MRLLKFFLPATVAIVGMAGCTNFDVEFRGVFALNGEQADFTPSGPYERGKAHLKSGHLGLAARAFHAAIARGQDTVKTLNALAATYDLLRRFDLSAEYYDRALLRDPNSVQTLNNMGYSYLLQNDLAPASRYLAAAQKLDLARVEVSNGAGRRHMAARMRAYLQSKDISVVRLTNAESFSNMTTVIFYRSGFKTEADAIARLLPEPVTLKYSHDGENPVRVRLGGDFLDFDKTLIVEFGYEGNKNVDQS